MRLDENTPSEVLKDRVNSCAWQQGRPEYGDPKEDEREAENGQENHRHQKYDSGTQQVVAPLHRELFGCH